MRQRIVLDLIKVSISVHGYPPSLRELGDDLGIRSTNGVNDHLLALEKKGYIIRDATKSRGIRVTEFGEAAQSALEALRPIPPATPVFYLSTKL